MIKLKDLLFGTVEVPLPSKSTVVRVHTMDGLPIIDPDYRRTPSMRTKVRQALRSLGWAHHTVISEMTGIDNVICRRVLSDMRKKKMVQIRKTANIGRGASFEYRLADEMNGMAA